MAVIVSKGRDTTAGVPGREGRMTHKKMSLVKRHAQVFSSSSSSMRKKIREQTTMSWEPRRRRNKNEK
jgi:hypothetical protein